MMVVLNFGTRKLSALRVVSSMPQSALRDCAAHAAHKDLRAVDLQKVELRGPPVML